MNEWFTTGLTIEGTFPDLNAILKKAKTHYAVYANSKKKWTEFVAWSSISMPKIESYSNVFGFHWVVPNKRIDPDNIAFAKKFILDGLIMAKILPNDSFKYVGGFLDKFSINRENPCVSIKILSTKDLTFYK